LCRSGGKFGLEFFSFLLHESGVMPQPARRLEVFSESVIREMTRLSNRCGSINLAQGFPDFDPPTELIDALAVAIRGPFHQYAVTWGAPRFRQALARKHQRFSGLELDPDRHLVVTCGTTEAMMVAMMTACDPGDKVIVFSPFYENYAADAILTGAVSVHVPLHAPDFSFDRATVSKVVRERCLLKASTASRGIVDKSIFEVCAGD